MSRRVQSIALAAAAFLLGSVLGPAFLHSALQAQELATITVQQIGITPVDIAWTVASAGAPHEGSGGEETFQGGGGVYTLIVNPPAGFKTETEVIVNGETVNVSSSRTVNGTVAAGGTLRFVIKVQEDPEERGAISVTSSHAGIRVELTTPLGKQTVFTPYADRNAPAGGYSGIFHPVGCPASAPISTRLIGGSRAVLHLDFDPSRCAARREKVRESKTMPSRLTRSGKTADGGEIVPCHPSRSPDRSDMSTPLSSLGRVRSEQRRERRLEALRKRLMRPSALESSRLRLFGEKPPQRRD